MILPLVRVCPDRSCCGATLAAKIPFLLSFSKGFFSQQSLDVLRRERRGGRRIGLGMRRDPTSLSRPALQPPGVQNEGGEWFFRVAPPPAQMPGPFQRQSEQRFCSSCLFCNEAFWEICVHTHTTSRHLLLLIPACDKYKDKFGEHF